METIKFGRKLRGERMALIHKWSPKGKESKIKRSSQDALCTLSTAISSIDILEDLNQTLNAGFCRTVTDESQVDAETDPQKNTETFSHGNGNSRDTGMLEASMDSQDVYEVCESKDIAEVDSKMELNLVMSPSEQTVDSDEDNSFGTIAGTIRSENEIFTFSEYKSEHQNQAKENTVKNMMNFISSGLFNKKSKSSNIFSRKRSMPAKAPSSHHHTFENIVYPASSKGGIKTTSSKVAKSMTMHSVIEPEIADCNLASPPSIPVKMGFRTLSSKRLQTNFQLGKKRASSSLAKRPCRLRSMFRNKSNVTEKTTCEIKNISKKKKPKRKLRKEMKTIILQAFRETSSTAMLEKEGGAPVLEDLNLFSILTEAIRLNKQKPHETASSVMAQDLPQENDKFPLRKTIVEVCMKHLIIRHHGLSGTMMDDNKIIIDIKSAPEDDSGSAEKTAKNENKLKAPEPKNLSMKDIHQLVVLEKNAKGEARDLDGEDTIEDISVDNDTLDGTLDDTLEDEENSLVTFNTIDEEDQLHSPVVDCMESLMARDDHSTLSGWTEFIDEGVDRYLENNIDDHVISSLTDLGLHSCMKSTKDDVLHLLRALFNVDSDDTSLKDEITSSDTHVKCVYSASLFHS